MLLCYRPAGCRWVTGICFSNEQRLSVRELCFVKQQTLVLVKSGRSHRCKMYSMLQDSDIQPLHTVKSVSIYPYHTVRWRGFDKYWNSTTENILKWFNPYTININVCSFRRYNCTKSSIIALKHFLQVWKLAYKAEYTFLYLYITLHVVMNKRVELLDVNYGMIPCTWMGSTSLLVILIDLHQLRKCSLLMTMNKIVDRRGMGFFGTWRNICFYLEKFTSTVPSIKNAVIYNIHTWDKRKATHMTMHCIIQTCK